MSEKPDGPVLIALEDNADPAPSPAEAPPVPDAVPGPPGITSMQRLAGMSSRRPSRLARWFFGALTALLGFVVSVAAWDFVTGLMGRHPVLGGAAIGLVGLVVLILLLISMRELAALSRLRRLDGIQKAAERALATEDLMAAKQVAGAMRGLYANRPELDWGLARLSELEADQFDAEALLGLAEETLLAPLDQAALAEIEASARQVATVTAIVPLALADLATALFANLRMIRRIAEIYGGRSGTFGSWRLTRTVLAHLVATGAVAVGDDLIGSVAGGGVLSKLSRRFGEGVVNGALTARVGVAAIEVCRPLPRIRAERPSVTGLVRRALTGLFGKRESGEAQ